MNGRRSWSYAMWARYVAAGKTPVELRRRLELARLEAPAGSMGELERAADRKLAILEDRPVSSVDASPRDLATQYGGGPTDQADGADAQGSGGAVWWW